MNRKTQQELSKPWNKSFVKQLKMSYGSIDYVEHTQVTQKLIALIPDLKMELGSVFYDKVEDENGIRRKFLTGCEYTISGTIDGEFRTVTEAGMCDKPFFAEGRMKVANNGERLKECISDAVKRCGMRLGIGIELYDTQTWLSDYLDPKPKAKAKPKPKPKVDTTKLEEKTNITSDDLKVSKEKMDNLIKDIAKDKKIEADS